MSSKTFDNIEELAKNIVDSDREIFLYYAFNGMGKTRLSMELRKLVEKDNNIDEYPKILRILLLIISLVLFLPHITISAHMSILSETSLLFITIELP